MKVQSLTGGFDANCYLLTEGADAVLIDAAAEPEDAAEALKAEGAELRAILLTHGHYDHLLTLAELCARFGAPVYLHEGDADFPEDGKKNASGVIFARGMTYPPADRLIRGDEALSFGALTLRVLHTPGHTSGSVTYLCDKLAFTGDTLFAAGIGRTDLYGGKTATLLRSLDLLRTLPRDTVICPGHGDGCYLSSARYFK